MHELGLAQAIVKQLEQIARDNNLVRVTKVILSAGPLAGIKGDFLSDCITGLTEGTAIEGVEVVVKMADMEDFLTEEGPSEEAGANVASAMDVYIESVEGDVE